MPLLLLKLLLALALLICLSSFTWAMRKFFVHPERMTTGLRITLAAGFVFALTHFAVIFLAPAIQPGPAISALALYGIALVIFWSAISANRAQPLSACFSRNEDLHLIQHGPYRFVRHPFYCSYLLTWLAGALATLNILLALTFVVMFVLYLVAARSEENKFAASPLADAYSRYRNATGQFFPDPLKLLNRRFQ